jgi:anthranilate synthase component I
VTEPWGRFVAESSGAEVAGYLERPGPRGRSGSAVWYRSPEEVLTVTRDSDSERLGDAVERFLRGAPHSAVAGYLGFDAFGLFEPALRSFPAGSPYPLGELALVRRLRSARVPPQPRRPAYPLRPRRPAVDSLPRRRFQRSVERLIESIRAGEAFQVVLAHRRSWPRPDDLLARAGELRRRERFSCFYYLRFGDREVVGASPESVAEVRGSAAYIDPIAGTIPRGARGRRPLAVDPKELCEHRMLVDLARNDLGRVARTGTVRLLWQERLVRYAALEHLVSRVGARLGPRTRSWDVLAATFPAGTVSGAPKIRATELLRAEERSWRGPYGGAVALLRPGRQAQFALAIRSAFAAGRTLHTAAGAGIVHRSRPAQEFDETLAKLAVVEGTLVGDGR